MYGLALGEALGNVVQQFEPTRIVLGGQITKAYDLFGDSFLTALKKNSDLPNIPVSVTRTEHLAIQGAAHYAVQKHNEEL